MSDNDGLVDFQQRQEALNCSASYIIQAPAGSGKTGVLTQRILGLLALVEKPEEVVAITFTKKAAGEMRQRVLESLMAAKGQVCPENPYDAQTWHLSQAVIGRDQAMGWDLLRYPNRLKIQTIDGFCGSLVKQMPFESSMGSMPAIEEDASLVYEKAAKQLLNSVGEGEFYDKALTSLLKHLDNNYRLAVSLIAQMLSKRDHWLENVMSVRSHDDLKYRMEESLNAVIDDQINAINNSVPSDIRQQLMSLSLYAAQNLQAEGHESPIRAALEYENDAGFIDTPQAWVVFSELLLTKGKPNYRKRLDAKTGFPAPTGSKNAEEKQLRKERKDNAMALIALLEEELPGFNDRLYEVKNLPLAGYSDEQWALLVDLLDLMPVAVGYLNLMWQSSGSVDFTEISMAALRSLGSAEEPTDLILKYDHRISHLLVDEFQDTSILQIQLLEKLTSGWQQGDGRTLFLVGDPMQGIYSFRKADIGLFLSVWHERRLADVTLTPLKLETNFRSDQKVIHWVNNVFSSAFPRQDDSRVGAVSYSHSVAAKSGGEKAGVSLKIFQQNTIDKNLENEDDQFEYPDKEAEYIAQTIEALREKDQANNKRYAVLVRSKSHAKPIINQLQARNIPIRAVDIDTLQESPVIQQLLGLTRALLRPSDRVGWYSVLRGACVGLTLSSLEKLHSVNIYAPIWDNLSFVVNRIGEDDSVDFDDAEANKLKQVVALFSFYYNKRKQFNVRDAIESLWLNLGGYLADPSLQARNDAEKYFALLETFEDSGDLANIQALEQKAMSLFSSPGSVDPSAVQIMSMHKSKGLEFDYVFLPYAAKRGRGDDRPLLIVDNQLSPATGQQALFLAALPERGGDAQGDAVYEFLWSTHSAKLKNELSRLTYVACTRAKQHLYITGTLGTDKKDNIKPPSGGTILGSLWAGVEMNNLLNDVSLVDPVVKAIQQLNHGKEIRIDTVKMNGRPFVNLAGLGFDGWVSYKLKESKFRGFLGYGKIVTQESFKFKPQTYQINIDGKILEEECLCLEIVNAPMFGYNFEIAPHAKFNDGILEMVIVKKMTPWKLPQLAWHSFQKTINESGLTKCYSGKNIKVKIVEETAVHIDGEGMLVNEDLEFSINPLSLSVWVPK
ncbi:MAG: hypothetical protein COA99_16300 [Moraxellaceae bacterium]|nr:MAG: hypothetical protein COA99_16300 [Moraxellaceae bacterium]